MAKVGESNDEDGELEDLDRQIDNLRLAKNEVFERTRSDNNELEKIAKLERECIDKRNRLRTEKHEREVHQQTVQRVIELESELKQAKCENVKLSDTVRKLKNSLDRATKYSKAQKRKITELESKTTVAGGGEMVNIAAQERSETANSVAVVEIQKQLNHTTKLLDKTVEELNETRQRLSDVQERLTVAEQVTAATQQRELQEYNSSEELPLEMISQYQLTTYAGSFSILWAIATFNFNKTVVDVRLCPGAVPS